VSGASGIWRRFGASWGVPVRRCASKLTLYPIISWQETRTQQLAEQIVDLMDPAEIFAETGYQIIYFNTLLRLMWLRQNAPEALESADYWLMMPGILNMKLCGELSIDPTAASTMMAMNMGIRDWSAKMLALAELDAVYNPARPCSAAVLGRFCCCALISSAPRALPLRRGCCLSAMLSPVCGIRNC